jgi:hypothetical protein
VSFLHNWVFLTPGLYLGQKQTLTGGYKVGQQLPSFFRVAFRFSKALSQPLGLLSRF